MKSMIASPNSQESRLLVVTMPLTCCALWNKHLASLGLCSASVKYVICIRFSLEHWYYFIHQVMNEHLQRTKYRGAGWVVNIKLKTLWAITSPRSSLYVCVKQVL